jgi:hypothetical protein
VVVEEDATGGERTDGLRLPDLRRSEGSGGGPDRSSVRIRQTQSIIPL